MALALSALVAFSSPPFAGIDETAHTSYALEVMHGHLPTMDTPVRRELSGMLRVHIYVANHPPLYYVFAGIPLRLGIAVDRPVAGLMAARLLSALFLAAGIAASIWALRLLLPRRPRIALIAGAFFAVFPMFAQLGSVVMNDTAAFATVSLALAAAILVLQRGLSWRRAGLLAFACAAAALTRSNGLPVTLIALAACLLAAFRERPPGSRLPSRRALAMTGCVPIAVVVTAAWFYIRNAVLYGDATGASRALRIFTTPPHISIADSAVSERFWEGLYQQLFGRAHYVFGTPKILAYLPAALVLAGLLVRVVQSLARAVRIREFSLSRAVGEPATQGVLLLAAQTLLTVVPFFLYASRGGATFTRYLVPGALFVALVAAWALDALPGRRYALAALLALGSLTWVSVQLLSQDSAWRRPALLPMSTFGRLTSGMKANAVPAATFLTAGLLTLVAGGFVMLAFALCKVGESRPPEPVVAAHGQASATHRPRRSSRAAAYRPVGALRSEPPTPLPRVWGAAGWLPGSR